MVRFLVVLAVVHAIGETAFGGSWFWIRAGVLVAVVVIRRNAEVTRRHRGP